MKSSHRETSPYKRSIILKVSIIGLFNSSMRRLTVKPSHTRIMYLMNDNNLGSYFFRSKLFATLEALHYLFIILNF